MISYKWWMYTLVAWIVIFAIAITIGLLVDKFMTMLASKFMKRENKKNKFD